MRSQLIIFLLLFGGVQGLLFSLFLFRKKLYRNGYIFLLFYMGVILLQLTLKLMNKLWLMENWGLLYSLSHFLPLLYGPVPGELLFDDDPRLTPERRSRSLSDGFLVEKNSGTLQRPVYSYKITVKD